WSMVFHSNVRRASYRPRYSSALNLYASTCNLSTSNFSLYCSVAFTSVVFGSSGSSRGIRVVHFNALSLSQSMLLTLLSAAKILISSEKNELGVSNIERYSMYGISEPSWFPFLPSSNRLLNPHTIPIRKKSVPLPYCMLIGSQYVLSPSKCRYQHQ